MVFIVHRSFRNLFNFALAQDDNMVTSFSTCHVWSWFLSCWSVLGNWFSIGTYIDRKCVFRRAIVIVVHWSESQLEDFRVDLLIAGFSLLLFVSTTCKLIIYFR